MTVEQKSKKAFIEGKLFEVICDATKGAVKSLTYTCPNPYDEIVTIEFDGGCIKMVRVTGDSKWGCMVDVIQAVNY